MRKLLPLLAKMDQEDRNLILFLAGRVSKKQRGMKAGRKLAYSLRAPLLKSIEINFLPN